MIPVTLDFETFYDKEYTLSKLGNEAYIRDARFEGIGVGVEVEGEAEWMEVDNFRRFAAVFPWKDAGVLAHHAQFDGLVLSHHFGVRPGFWFDTLSMGRALHGAEAGNSLAALALRYGIGEKGHEVDKAKGKHRADFSPAEWAEYGRYCLNDCALAKTLFLKMAPHFSEEELWHIDATIRMFTEPKLALNREKLVAYLATETARKTELLARSNVDRSVLLSNDKFAEVLKRFSVEPPTKTSPTSGEDIFAFAKSDPGMVELLNSPRDEVRWLAEARVGVKSTINESRTARLIGVSQRGPLAPVYLKYSGAHTNRWSGGDLSNWQNFQRGGAIRDAIEAPAGKTLVVADSSNIEARGVAWLAAHTHLLDAFREGRDTYCEFASGIYRRTITKADKKERSVGKTAVLGLGYQMGWTRFAVALAAGPMGAEPVIFTEEDAAAMGVEVGHFAGKPGVEAKVAAMPSRLDLPERLVHCAVADYIVQRWRDQNQPVRDLWNAMQGVPALMDDEMSWGKVVGPLRIERHALRRPCGLSLRYPGLEERDDGWGYIGGFGKKRVRLYGGILVENIVQALARDVVAHQMTRMRRELGYEVALMTHDEVVLVVDEAEGERALENALRIMREPPAWATGWPLNAEGAVNRVYGEAK